MPRTVPFVHPIAPTSGRARTCLNGLQAMMLVVLLYGGGPHGWPLVMSNQGVSGLVRLPPSCSAPKDGRFTSAYHWNVGLSAWGNTSCCCPGGSCTVRTHHSLAWDAPLRQGALPGASGAPSCARTVTAAVPLQFSLRKERGQGSHACCRRLVGSPASSATACKGQGRIGECMLVPPPVAAEVGSKLPRRACGGIRSCTVLDHLLRHSPEAGRVPARGWWQAQPAAAGRSRARRAAGAGAVVPLAASHRRRRCWQAGSGSRRRPHAARLPQVVRSGACAAGPGAGGASPGLERCSLQQPAEARFAAGSALAESKLNGPLRKRRCAKACCDMGARREVPPEPEAQMKRKPRPH